jgi:hypothetical protein
MTNNGRHIDIMVFETLKELLKTQDSPYILKYDLDDDDSIYYTLVSTAYTEIVVFCIDKNYKGPIIKLQPGGEFSSVEEMGANCISLAIVERDSILEEVLDSFAEEETPKKRKKK